MTVSTIKGGCQTVVQFKSVLLGFNLCPDSTSWTKNSPSLASYITHRAQVTKGEGVHFTYIDKTDKDI